MFVALDTKRGGAVTGAEVSHSGEASDTVAEHETGRYECLFCRDQLIYQRETTSVPERTECFCHANREDCLNDGSATEYHRLGQEVAAKRLYNLLPTSRDCVELDVESKIGGESDFLISDVRVSGPIRLAVEIVYQGDANLRRRLKTLFAEGYAGLFVFLENGEVSVDRIDHHMQKIGQLQVGRFNPQTLHLTFGSLVTPEKVDLHSSTWNHLPEYLA